MSDSPNAVVPHDIDAEEAIIASILVADDKLPAIRERVGSSDFYSHPCRLAYDAACHVADRGEQVNQISVANELSGQARGSNGTGRSALDEVGGPAWLSRIVLELPTPIGAEGYADIVSRAATYRQLISASAQITDMARQGGPEVDEIVRRAEVLLAGVADTVNTNVEPYTAISLDGVLGESDDESGGEVFISDGGEGAVVARDTKMAVAAGTGVGKTMVLNQMSRALCEGSTFLGLNILEPRSVLLIPLEGSARNGRRRLRKVWAGSDATARARLTVARLDRLDLMDINQLSRLNALIAEHRPDVVILDPLRHAHGLEENDNTAMALVTGVLDGIMARHECALILAHHDRKRPPFTKRDTGTDRVRGATAFTGWLTSCLSLDRDPSGVDRFLAEWTKTRDAEETLVPLALDFDRATLAFTIADRSADGTVSPDTILTAIWHGGGSARGPDLVRGFVEGSGASERAVRNALRALVADNRLVEFITDEDRKAGAKSYRLPDEELPGVDA